MRYLKFDWYMNPYLMSFSDLKNLFQVIINLLEVYELNISKFHI